MATGLPLSVFPHGSWPGASRITALLRRETVGGALFAARCFDLAGAQPHLPAWARAQSASFTYEPWRRG
jgi:hypothetical protein